MIQLGERDSKYREMSACIVGLNTPAQCHLISFWLEMIPIQLLCGAVRMSSVSVHICADIQIAKKSERKGRQRRRREICLRLQTELPVKLLC